MARLVFGPVPEGDCGRVVRMLALIVEERRPGLELEAQELLLQGREQRLDFA